MQVSTRKADQEMEDDDENEDDDDDGNRYCNRSRDRIKYGEKICISTLY